MHSEQSTPLRTILLGSKSPVPQSTICREMSSWPPRRRKLDKRFERHSLQNRDLVPLRRGIHQFLWTKDKGPCLCSSRRVCYHSPVQNLSSIAKANAIPSLA